MISSLELTVVSPQFVMENNAETVKIWKQMAHDAIDLGEDGWESAQRFLDLLETPSTANDVWTFACTLNLALSACAYQLPIDDRDAHDTLQALVKKHACLGWILAQERPTIGLEEINVELTGEALDQANARLNTVLDF